jgi:inorganic pyrophosphatase
VLELEDEAGGDEKILAVPLPKITRIYDRVASYRDIPEIDLQRIQHFFEHYKDLEPEKWVRVGSWREREEAHQLITEAIERATRQ